MGQPIYLADPAVAAAYHVAPGTWVWVGDSNECAYLLDNHHGYGLANFNAVPAPYQVHPDAPAFAPYPGMAAGKQPALITVDVAEDPPRVFTVSFGGVVDTVNAEAHFIVRHQNGSPLVELTYAQPAGTSRANCAGLLQTNLQPHTAIIATTKNGSLLELRGVNGTVLGGVIGQTTIPAAAGTARRRAEKA